MIKYKIGNKFGEQYLTDEDAKSFSTLEECCYEIKRLFELGPTLPKDTFRPVKITYETLFIC